MSDFGNLVQQVAALGGAVAGIVHSAVLAVEWAATPLAGSLFEGGDGSYVWEFLFVTVILGGMAARATGRANAATWRPMVQTVIYVIILGFAIRFLHFALFQRTLLSPQYYIVDEIVLQAMAAWSYTSTRAGQMATQYSWMFERSGLIGWRRRS